MKNLIFVFFIVLLNSFIQEKQKIIFLFEEDKDTIIQNSYETIYKISNNKTFRFIEKKHHKKRLNTISLKKN